MVSDRVNKISKRNADAEFQVLKRRSQHHHGCLHSSIAFASTQELESANETEIHTHGSVRPWR